MSRALTAAATLSGAGVLVQRVADRDDRRLVAAAHARRPHDPHPVAEALAQLAEQRVGAREGAGQAVAYPHGYRRRRLVVHDDVEMGVERGDLVDFCQRQPHLLGQRDEMARVQAAELVLQQMQVLDQQVAAPLALPEQCLHLGKRRRVELAALRLVRAAPPPGAGMDAAIVGWLRTHKAIPIHSQDGLSAAKPIPAAPIAGGSRAARPRPILRRPGSPWKLHRAVVVQLLDISRAVAEPAQHLVGVLAEQGRTLHHSRRVRKA